MFSPRGVLFQPPEVDAPGQGLAACRHGRMGLVLPTAGDGSERSTGLSWLEGVPQERATTVQSAVYGVDGRIRLTNCGGFRIHLEFEEK